MPQSNQTPQSQSSIPSATAADRLGLYLGDTFQAKALVDFLGLNRADLSHICRVPIKFIRLDLATSTMAHEQLEQIGSTCNLVAAHFNGARSRTALWFKTKNPTLGDIAPRDMIRFGRHDKLRRFVIGALAESR